MTEVRGQEYEEVADLPEGFKMTELGPLPKEWEVVRLGRVFVPVDKKKRSVSVQSGRIYRTLTVRLYGRGIALREDIEGGRIGTPVLYRAEPHDFVFSKIDARNGAWGFVPEELGGGFVSGDFPILQLIETIADREFMALSLSRPSTWEPLRDIAVGTTNRRRIQVPQLTHITIPLPPLSEQRAIADVLRTVQRAREATEEVIQATRELKKSLMRHLFTYGPVPIEQAGRVPLKETEIGFVPEHWETVRLGEVALVKGGKRLPKGHKFACRPTPYPYVRVADFKDGSVEKANLRFLTPQDHEAIEQYTISSRDVYISIAGTIGLVGVIPPELDGANLTENAARIVLKDYARIEQRFLHYLLSSKLGQEQISLRTTKTSQPKLALARIKEIVLPLPAPGEQRKLACILEAADKKLRAEEAKKQALETLFKTLLHNLMTGKIRVSDLALSESEGVV